MDSEGSINASFANYPGTGLVFGLIAHTEKGSSMYVPVHTFGCNYTTDPNFCYYLVNTSDRVEIVVLCVVGLILCFCGYEWESFELYVTVSVLTGLVSYAALYNISLPSGLVLTVTVSGLVVGCAVLICSALINWVHLRHITAFFNLGLLLSSVILFFTLGNSDTFKYETLYWSTFLAIAITAFCLLYIVRSHSHRYTTAIVGSFMAILTLDYFAGTSLKFIVFDVIRRYSVKDFILANIDPPFQTPDVVLAVIWGLVATFSVIYQLRRGYSVVICQRPNEETNEGCTYDDDDTTPLLTSPNSTNYYQY